MRYLSLYPHLATGLDRDPRYNAAEVGVQRHRPLASNPDGYHAYPQRENFYLALSAPPHNLAVRYLLGSCHACPACFTTKHPSPTSKQVFKQVLKYLPIVRLRQAPSLLTAPAATAPCRVSDAHLRQLSRTAAASVHGALLQSLHTSHLSIPPSIVPYIYISIITYIHTYT